MILTRIRQFKVQIDKMKNKLIIRLFKNNKAMQKPMNNNIKFNYKPQQIFKNKKNNNNNSNNNKNSNKHSNKLKRMKIATFFDIIIK